MNIVFTNILGINDIFPPEPASKNIPDWYKDIDSYVYGEKKPTGKAENSSTIKRCMPVFDVINSGYIIKTAADIYVSQRESFDVEGKSLGIHPFYEWSSFDAINFHPIEQAPNHPHKNGHMISYPKFINFWGIETPKGYSCLFVQPFHRDSVFTILPGVVDTDKYVQPVNFPFVLNDIKWEGLIPAGTPIAQVVPFKREDWNMEIGTKSNIEKTNQVHNLLKTKFFDSYKNQFRSGTTYK